MFKLSLVLPAALNTIETAMLCECMGDDAVSYSALRSENHEHAPWILEWLFEDAPTGAVVEARLRIVADIHHIELPEMLDIQHEQIDAQRDWLSYSYQQFPPFSVGPFFIYGSHYEGDVPADQMGLQIDAATAFGSGEHGTTAGCLQAMLDLKDQGACPWNVLDMGTGSGILAIAAWKLWKTPVLAVDNDPESLIVTRRHMAANGVIEGQGNVQAMVNEGFDGAAVADKGPFDLIIANILPGPLKDMADDLIACTDDNGYVILSGILNEQAPDVIAVYGALAFRKDIKIDGWSTLVLQKTV